MALHSVVLALSFCIFKITCSVIEKCHESIGQESLKYLGSKRPYNYYETQEPQYIPNGCTPVKFWYFGRHGTRTPEMFEILLMKTTLVNLHHEIIKSNQLGQGHLCASSLQHLLSWKLNPDLKVSDSYKLVEQGWNELSGIGRRYQKRFPNLFPSEFDNATYLFKHTAAERSEISAIAFGLGIFGPQNNLWMPKATIPDPVLRFYKSCPKHEMEHHTHNGGEYDKFIRSEVMKVTITSVSQRLGINRMLTFDELKLMYTTCGLETAWENGVTSPWCVPFDLEDFKVMSYMEDLEWYWKDGYGREINYHQACPPFKDLIQYFETYIENPENDQRRFQGYFSHSKANMRMLARLGLFPTPPMRASNYAYLKNIYNWKSSFIDTFASNMAFMLFKCPEHYKVGFYFQELPTEIPACNGQKFCAFNDFRRKIREFTTTCNLEKICAVQNSSFSLMFNYFNFMLSMFLGLIAQL